MMAHFPLKHAFTCLMILSCVFLCSLVSAESFTTKALSARGFDGNDEGSALRNGATSGKTPDVVERIDDPDLDELREEQEPGKAGNGHVTGDVVDSCKTAPAGYQAGYVGPRPPFAKNYEDCRRQCADWFPAHEAAIPWIGGPADSSTFCRRTCLRRHRSKGMKTVPGDCPTKDVPMTYSFVHCVGRCRVWYDNPVDNRAEKPDLEDHCRAICTQRHQKQARTWQDKPVPFTGRSFLSVVQDVPKAMQRYFDAPSPGAERAPFGGRRLRPLGP